MFLTQAPPPVTAPAPPAASPVRLRAAPASAPGYSPHIRVEGLEPGETVRLHALRRMPRQEPQPDGSWGERTVTLHAWADLTAGRDGRIVVDTATPIRGTWRRADGLAPLWSGYVQGAPELTEAADPAFYALRPTRPDGAVLRVTRAGAVIASAETRILSAAPNTRFSSVEVGDVNGVFAVQPTARPRPAVIILHGSEGGDLTRARNVAARYAAWGYAAFALNYWAPQRANLPGVPRRHLNQPIELIGRVRDWLSRQPEVDASRIAVAGHSKGAEFAAVAAVRYPWIRAVIACVPTDVVWEGAATDDWRGGGADVTPARSDASSWSWQGTPLPYVPLYGYREDAGYRTNTDRYDRSRAEHPERAVAAVIPLETARARVLVIGGDRDAVWASGPMARVLGARFAAAGRAQDVEVRTYPLAGHNICGDGVYPSRLYGTQGSEPWAENITANGEASVDAWRTTVRFLATTLRR